MSDLAETIEGLGVPAAIEQRRVVERRLQALVEISRLVTLGLEERAILRHITEAIARLLEAPYAGLWMVETETGDLVVVATAGALRGAFRPGFRRGAGERTLNRVVLEAGQVYQTDDVEAHPSWVNHEFSRRHGVSSYLGVPLMVGDQRYGVLALLFHGRRLFSAEDLELVAGLAAQASVALANARAFLREQERRRQLEAVRAVTAELTRELDLTTLLELITHRAADLLGVSAGAVFLWDETARVLVPRAWIGLGEWIGKARFALGQGVAGAAAERRSGVVVNDFRASPLATELVLANSALGAALAEPILYQERLIGVLTLGREGAGGRPFTEGDRELLRLFADQAAVAIEHAHLFEQAARVEALGELARLKTEFLRTISHELRTPLWLIQGYAELLATHAARLAPEQLNAMAGEIHHGARTMVRLVDDLLEFAQTEQSQLRLKRRRVSVIEVIERLVETFRRQPGGERIVTRLPRRLEAAVDPDRVSQILSHLLANALRYAPDGPIELRLSRERRSMRVEVRDEGPGIPPHDEPRIWERFYRGIQEVNSPNRGSGLGLSVVKHLVELHGGQVGVRGTHGRGATFWFILPLNAPTETA